jgi:hypothetical protein
MFDATSRFVECEKMHWVVERNALALKRISSTAIKIEPIVFEIPSLLKQLNQNTFYEWLNV